MVNSFTKSTFMSPSSAKYMHTYILYQEYRDLKIQYLLKELTACDKKFI